MEKYNFYIQAQNGCFGQQNTWPTSSFSTVLNDANF